MIEKLVSKNDFNKLKMLILTGGIKLDDVVIELLKTSNTSFIYKYIKLNYDVPYDMLIKRILELRDYQSILEILKDVVTESDKMIMFINSTYGLDKFLENWQDDKQIIELIKIKNQKFKLTLYEESILRNLPLLIN